MLVLFSKCSPERCGNAATEIMQQPFSPLFVFFGCKAPLEYPQNLLLSNKRHYKLGAEPSYHEVWILDDNLNAQILHQTSSAAPASDLSLHNVLTSDNFPAILQSLFGERGTKFSIFRTTEVRRGFC